LARAIAAGHSKERAESMERRRELSATVFAIVKELLAHGEHPAEEK
jgi:hypothetical protein